VKAIHASFGLGSSQINLIILAGAEVILSLLKGQKYRKKSPCSVLRAKAFLFLPM
jgi:hypothetical protein